MIRKTLLVLLWFPCTLILLLVNLTLLSATTRWGGVSLPLSAVAPNESGFAASSGTPEVLSASVIAGDARVLLLETFFKNHKSPMAPYADLIVRESDAKGFDFRLIPAIAMCESNLGKRVPLKKGFNPFGIAVYTGQQFGKDFDSWQHAIQWVSKYIKEKYYDMGFTTLTEIGAKWAPPSAANGNSWANCVEFFQESII